MIVFNCIVVDPDKEDAVVWVVLPPGVKCCKRETIVFCKHAVLDINNKLLCLITLIIIT